MQQIVKKNYIIMQFDGKFIVIKYQTKFSKMIVKLHDDDDVILDFLRFFFGKQLRTA